MVIMIKHFTITFTSHKDVDEKINKELKKRNIPDKDVISIYTFVNFNVNERVDLATIWYIDYCN